MRDIIPGTVAITTSPKKGKEITSNEILLEFDVEVDGDGCYVIEVRLLEDDDFLKGGDDIVLDNSDAYKTAFCLKSGVRQKFRVTTSKPAPPGSTAPPAPAAGTITLPPIDGKWPDDDGAFDDDVELKYEIRVYFIGPCTASGGCDPVKADELPDPYMTHTGPNTGSSEDIKPIDRTVIALAGTDDTRLAAAGAITAARFAGRAFAISASNLPASGGPKIVDTVSRRRTVSSSKPLVISNKFVEIQLRPAQSTDTLGANAIEVTRYRLRDGEKRFTAQFFVKDVFPKIDDLGKALLQIEEAYATGNLKRAIVPFTGIVRHGRMTIFDRGGLLTGYFYENRFNGIWNPGEILLSPPSTIFLAGTGGSAAPAAAPNEVSETAWMTDEWYVYPFAWILAGSDYADDIAELISDTIDPAIKRNDCFKEFEIQSHGGKIASRNGTVVGSYIKMGSDNLRSDDFDASGNPRASATATKQLLDKLKAVMCPGGKLIFSACNQEVGDLVKNMSKYINKGVTVIGNSGTGIPEIEGDMQFKDGTAVPKT